MRGRHERTVKSRRIVKGEELKNENLVFVDDDLVNPGVAIKEHADGWDKLYYLLAGKGENAPVASIIHAYSVFGRYPIWGCSRSSVFMPRIFSLCPLSSPRSARAPYPGCDLARPGHKPARRRFRPHPRAPRDLRWLSVPDRPCAPGR